MKIYHKNAELYLLDKVKHIKEQRAQWRCIYMHFSHAATEYSDGLRTHMVVNIIRELLQGEEGFVYLLSNSDVCILFQGSAQRIYNKLGTHFATLLTLDHADDQHKQLFTLIELGNQWEMFFSFCSAKVAVMLAEHKHASAPQEIIETETLTFEDFVYDKEGFTAARQLRTLRRKLSVMVVEDDAFTRRLIANVLRQHYDIIDAADGTTALTRYCQKAPDVVFLDIDLPDTNGHILLQKIRSLDPAAFVVMLSANSYKENILASLEDGAHGFITKPFAKEKLLHYLRQYEHLKPTLTHFNTIGGAA